MSREATLLGPFGMMLKIVGLIVAVLAAFASKDPIYLVKVGLIIVMLGYFVILLDEIFNRPDSLPPIDSPSIRSRWKIGFTILLLYWFLLAVVLRFFRATVDWIAQNVGISFSAALGLKVLAFAILGPLIFSAFSESQIWPRLRAFWLRGFKFGVLAGLVTLPWILLQQVCKLILRLGAIDTDSRMAADVRLLVGLVAVLVGPFWILPLFRRLSESPLGRHMMGHVFQGNFNFTYCKDKSDISNEARAEPLARADGSAAT